MDAHAGTVGYTAQDPWICNATLRNNVLMGRPYQEDLYRRYLFWGSMFFGVIEAEWIWAAWSQQQLRL